MSRATSARTGGLLPLTLVAALLAGSAARAALVPYDAERLVDRSSRVVLGRVTAVESRWGRMGRMGRMGPVILTDVTIEVAEHWKAPVDAGTPRTVVVRLLGGEVEGTWQLCPESPEFERGEDVVVFARPWRGDLWVTGWLQGKYRVVRDEDGVARLRGAAGAPLPRGTSVAELRTWVAARLRSGSGTDDGDAPAPSGTPDAEESSGSTGEDDR